MLRCNPDVSDLELVAWGLRNPYGVAFHPDGRLFATEHGIDERNARHIIGDLEDFYEITEGAWYGWPDFASGIRLDHQRWGTGGRGREPVLAQHPDPDPPKPFTTFPMHSGPNGMDFCRDAGFGFQGDAFVTLYGDLTPVTARLTTPAGFAGMERPSRCQFGADGALYVVDFGEVSIAPEKGGIRVWEGTGTLWRIRRTTEPTEKKPPAPREVPSYAIKAALGGIAGIAGVSAVANWVFRRRRGER